jgi:hypothetical protein
MKTNGFMALQRTPMIVGAQQPPLHVSHLMTFFAAAPAIADSWRCFLSSID